MTEFTIDHDNASLRYEVQGQGSPLLMIAGAGGNRHVYRYLAQYMSQNYQVITYDRRGNGQSASHDDQDLDMKQQAQDALAVLHAAGHQRAAVFGNSGGGSIALVLATYFPKAVQTLIVHEPPVLNVLNEQDSFDFVDRVCATHQHQGAFAAMRVFLSRMIGLKPDRSANASIPVATNNRPRGFSSAEDMEFFFSHEYRNMTLVDIDVPVLRELDMPKLVMKGALSQQAYYARSAEALAQALECDCVTVPGHHVGFVNQAEEFGAVLNDCFLELEEAHRPLV